MKRLSRLTALLLALVLMLSSGLSAVAESITTKEQYFAAARRALKNAIMGTETYQDYRSIADLIELNIINEFFETLSEEEFQNIVQHVKQNFWDACTTYDNVGPFLPPVDYTVYSRSKSSTFSVLEKADGDETTKENGLILKKTAEKKSDGIYQVQLESYVTGTVTSEEVYIPCDIALVLDFSSSMSEDHVEGEIEKDRILFLQDAVNDFIRKTNAAYSEKADHRITLITFDGEGEERNPWTFVSNENLNDLLISDDEIKTEDQGGWLGSGTNPGEGMELANNALSGTAGYIGNNTTRQKVVIMFTDGRPSNISYAADAINYAKEMKGYGTTVFAVALMTEATPGTSVSDYQGSGGYGSYVNPFLHAVSSNYPNASSSVTGDWWNQTLRITLNERKSDQYYLSTNDSSLSSIFNKIAENIDAGASMNLGSSTVVKDIVTPQFVLPANASNFTIQIAECKSYNDTTHASEWYDPVKVTDNSITVTPVTASKTLKVSGFDYSANYVSQNAYNRDDPEATTGRNYHGSKLIITFDVTPEPDFLGGFDVDTNTKAAVETADGKEIELYTKPVVDVPLKKITPVVEDQYIYLSNRADLKALLGTHDETKFLKYTLNGTEYQVDGDNNAYVDITYTFKDASDKVIATYFIPKGATSGTMTYYDSNGNTTDLAPVLTEDTTYTIECEIKATTVRDEKTLTATATDTATATVFVYKPVLTFIDSEVEFNTDITEINSAYDSYKDYYEGENYKGNVLYWQGNYRAKDETGKVVATGTGTVNKNGQIVDQDGNVVNNKVYTESEDGTITVADAAITMSGDEPNLDLTYTPAYEWLTGTLVSGKTDVPVNVTVTAEGDTTMDVTDDTLAIRMTCNVSSAHRCDFVNTYNEAHQIAGKDANGNAIPEFVVHIFNVYGQLSVTKTVTDGRENVTDASKPIPAATFVFDVELKDKDKNSLTNLPYSIGTLANGQNTVGSSSSTTKISDGGQVSLTDGQTVTIWNLPPEATFKITEVVTPGFISTPDSEEGTITAGKTSEVTFNNTFTPEHLTIIKRIYGADGVVSDPNVNDDEFKFRITLPEGSYELSDQFNKKSTLVFDSENKTHDVTITGSNTLTINGIPVYSEFKVEELTLPAGYTYQSVDEKNVTTDKIVNDGTKLYVESKIAEDGSTVEFINYYTTTSLTIKKNIDKPDANTVYDEFNVKVTLPKGKYTVNGSVVDFGSTGTEKNVTVDIPGLTTESPITIEGIPVEAAYVVEEYTDKDNLPTGYDPNGVTYTNGSGNVVANGTIAEINNTYHTGTLKISKTVLNKFVDDQFTFRVALPNGTYDYTVSGSSTKKTLTVSNGVGEIKLKDGQTATITGIPAGTSYTVTESANNAYSTTYTGASGTISKDNPAVAAFTNTHKLGNLAISKIVRGANVDPADKFSFTVTLAYRSYAFKTIQAERAILNGDASSETVTFTSLGDGKYAANVSVGNGETVTLKNLPAGATYTVTEFLEEPSDYIKKDELTVHTHNGSDTQIDAGQTDSIVFTNDRKDSGLVISKTVLDANGGSNLTEAEMAKDFTFTITLTAPEHVTLERSYSYTKTGEAASQTLTLTEVRNADNQIIDENGNVVDADTYQKYMTGTITLKHGQSAEFTSLPVGTTYTIVETVDSDFEVTPEDGYEGTTVVDDPTTDEVEATEIAAFTNKHKYGYLAISKEIVNNSDYELPGYVAKTFAFKVYLPNGTYDYTIDGGAVKKLVVSGGYGTITLGDAQTATIKLPPETAYDVVENVPAGYVSTKVVTENNKTFGVIDATKTDKIDFSNAYTPASLQIVKNIVDQNGNMIADGKPVGAVTDDNVKDDVFTFTVAMPNLPNGLYPVEIAGNVKSDSISNGYFDSTIKGTDSKYRIVITGAGNVTINAIPVSDDAHFTVTESAVSPSVGYTGHSILVDNLNASSAEGTLDIDHRVMSVEFNNIYATGDLTIRKQISGEDGNTDDDVFYVNVSGIPAGKYKVNGVMTTFDGVERFAITTKQDIKIEGIPVGTQYTVTEDTDKLPTGYYASGVSYDANKTGTIDTAGKTTTITNTYNSGILKITKNVVGQFVVGDTFNFTVKLPNGTYSYTISGVEGAKNLVVSDGRGTIDLQHGQTATITGIPLDAEYEVAENLTDEQKNDYVVNMADETGTVVADNINTADDETAHAVFTNTHNTGSLEITKTVDNVVSSAINPEKFTFTVTIDDEDGVLAVDGTYSYTISGAEGVKSLIVNNGSGTLELQHGQKAIITGLPAGASYTVTETADADYTTKVSSNDDAAVAGYSAEGTIDKTVARTAAYINTRKLGELEISKTVVPVDGYDLTDYQKGIMVEDAEGLSFEFTIRLSAPDGVDLNGAYKYDKYAEDSLVEREQNLTFINGEAKVDLKHLETIVIKGLPVGTTYTVVEKPDAEYAKTVSKNDADVVAEAADGTDGTIDEDGEKLEYINNHMPGQLKVTKHIIVPKAANPSAGDDSATGEGDLDDIPSEIDKEFTFYVILRDEKGNELPNTRLFDWYKNGVKQDQKIGSGGSFILGNDEYMTIEGLLPGTHYTVWEAPEYGYITRSTITDESTPVTENVIDAGKQDTVTYVNTYNPETLVIRKEIENGDANSADDVFYFDVTLPISETPYILSDTDPNTEDVELYFTQNKPTHTLPIVGEASLAISGIPLYYSYTVKESGMPNGYAIKTVEPLRYNESNQLVSDERTITQVTGAQVTSAISYRGNEIVFTNKYTTGELKVTKNVIGEDAPKDANGNFSDEFDFTVKFYKDSTMSENQTGTFSYVIKDASGAEVANGTGQITNGTGTFKLKHGQTATITDVPENTYYVVTESKHSDYSTEKTNDTGMIVADDPATEEDETKEAVFVNSFKYGSLTIHKKFKAGVTPDAGETFLFTVTGPEGYETKIVIARDGSVTINSLPVGEYTVKEDDSWSWRYSSSSEPSSGKVTVTSGQNGEITFENDLSNDKWLDGNTSAENIFDGTSNKGPSDNDK